MAFPVNNNFNKQQSSFYNETQGFNNPTNKTSDLQQPQANFLASLFAFLSKSFGSGNNPAMQHLSNLFSGQQPQAKVEDYGGFKFKNDGEKTKVDEALKELRSQQAANPGKSVSKKFKIGKYKFKVSLDENGQVKIKKKKKKKGLFGKIGGAFKKIGKGLGKAFKKVGGIVKKALPIISTIAMFIPGLQPLALAGRIASGVIGVVDGIKNGNIFGAVTSAFGAMAGIGGKIGQFASNLSSKAGGFINNIGSGLMSKMGNVGNIAKNLFTKGTGFLNQGKGLLSNFAGKVGNKISDLVSGHGLKLLGNTSNSIGGKIGSWLTQKGPDFIKNFATSLGQKASNWVTDKAHSLISKLSDNPISRKIKEFLNSPFMQMFSNLIRNNKA